MRALVLSLLLLFFGGVKVPDPISLESHPPLIVATEQGVTGHGCPIETPAGPIILTARHIVARGELGLWQKFAWSVGEIDGGATGHAVSWGDYVVFRPLSGRVPPHLYKVRQTPPTVGEPVWIWGFDDWPWKDKLVKTEVTSVRAGHVFYEKGALGGSSGSCVFDKNGEVVAINTLQYMDHGSPVDGAGVGLWSPFFAMLVEE